MERKNYKHVTYCTLCTLMAFVVWSHTLSSSVSASGYTTFQNLIFRAYVEGRMTLWESTLASMEFEYGINSENDLLYDIILAQYGLIAYYIGIGDKKNGSILLDKASGYLETLEQAEHFKAEAGLFKAAFNAYQISFRPLLSVRLGPQSQRLINGAVETRPEYPRGWIEKGNLMYYAPAVFGGSKTKAIEYYGKALRLMEKDMQNNHRWLYLSTLVALANAYEHTGQNAAAIETLEKALAFEPDFAWVRDELLPEFISKHQ